MYSIGFRLCLNFLVQIFTKYTLAECSIDKDGWLGCEFYLQKGWWERKVDRVLVPYWYVKDSIFTQLSSATNQDQAQNQLTEKTQHNNCTLCHLYFFHFFLHNNPVFYFIE